MCGGSGSGGRVAGAGAGMKNVQRLNRALHIPDEIEAAKKCRWRETDQELKRHDHRFNRNPVPAL